MNSPFTAKDPIVSKAGIILSLYSLVLLLFFCFIVIAEVETKTLQKQVILPAQAWFHTQMSQVALDIANDARKRQEKSLELQEIIKNSKASQEQINDFVSRSVSSSSSTIIINNTTSPQKQKIINSDPESNTGSTYTPPPISQEQLNFNFTSPSFDEAEWQKTIDQMKADTQARYEESMAKQRAWSDQKSIENSAWMDEQRAKTEADLEKWKAENGW